MYVCFACIKYNEEDLATYNDAWFKKETYFKAYRGMIHPLPDKALWKIISSETIHPPKIKRMLGRLKLNRHREKDDIL